MAEVGDYSPRAGVTGKIAPLFCRPACAGVAQPSLPSVFLGLEEAVNPKEQAPLGQAVRQRLSLQRLH